MRMLSRALAGVFLAALTLGLLAQAGRVIWLAFAANLAAEAPPMARREQGMTVNAVTVAARTVSPTLVVHGEIRATRTLDLRAAAGGTAQWVAPAFVEGGVVAAGEVLLRLDPAEAARAVALADADMADAEAERRAALRALPLAQDELAAAEAQAELRARALQRQRDLSDRGVGIAPDLEAAELAASAADQTVLARRQAVAAAEARIDQAASALTRAALARDEAGQALADTELRAAFDGVLTGVAIAAGARVAANELLGQLIDPASREVAFRLSTAQHARLIDDAGRIAAVPVTVSAGPGAALTATGTIAREGAGDGLAGRLVFAALAAAPGLRPGDFVTVTIAEPPLEDVAVLPAGAVGSDMQVLVIGPDDRLALRPVTLLRRQGDDVILALDGLDGARVVAERSPLLGAGIRVQVAGGGMVELTPDRRDSLIARVAADRALPEDQRAALLDQLARPRVPADLVARLESGPAAGG